MSLILDALRKLEREKTPQEGPGVLVVGSVPWGEKSKTRRLALVLGGVALLAGAVLAGRLLPSAPSVPAAAPTPLPSPTQALAAASPPRVQAAAPSTVLPTELPAAPPIRLSRPPAREAAPTTLPGAAPVQPDAQPAAPASTPAAAAPELRLNAISQRDGRPVALINDRLVFEGDSFDGVRVLRIGEAEVELEVDGQRRVLRF